MLDGGAGDNPAGLGKDPVGHVAAHSMGNSQPAPETGLLVSHVHLFLVPVPNSIKEIKIKPFGNVNCISSNTLDARSLVDTTGQ